MKVLVVHPYVRPPGGGEAVGAWALHALQDSHEVTLAAWIPPDFEKVNEFYGTAIDPTRVRVVLLPRLLAWLGDLPPTPTALLKCAIFFRWIRTIAHEHDLIISTINEWDFGARGIQYIHFPRLYLPRPVHDLRWYHPYGWMIEVYRNACMAIGQVDVEGIRRNLTFSNSEWTARHFEESHRTPSGVLHPPVPGGFEPLPWEDRVQRFLCIGRISGEKRVEDAIEILRQVRERGEEVRLDIVGSAGDPHYLARIQKLIEANADWVKWRGALSRPDYVRLLSESRFGLHPMREEHFGIAVAELLRAGCIPIVFSTGGPPEIVGNESLCFDSIEDGVEKVLNLLRGPGAIERTLEALAPRRELFTEERFIEGLLDAVGTFERGESNPIRG